MSAELFREKAETQLWKPVSGFVQPDFVIDKVHNLRVEDLIEQNMKTQSVGLIIFDVDNTLEDYFRPSSTDEPQQVLLPETIALLEKLRGVGYKLAIASNCDTTRGAVLKEIFSGLVDVIATPQDAKDMHALWGKKPTTGMHRYIQHELHENGLNFSPAQTLMIGDQILKDVLFGKFAHIKTVLTNKFGEHDHPLVERYQREHERRLRVAMGFRAVEGHPEFPKRLTPTKDWIKAQSGLIVPHNLSETDEY